MGSFVQGFPERRTIKPVDIAEKKKAWQKEGTGFGGRGYGLVVNAARPLNFKPRNFDD